MSIVIKPKINLDQLVVDTLSKAIEEKKTFLSFLENFIILILTLDNFFTFIITKYILAI